MRLNDLLHAAIPYALPIAALLLGTKITALTKWQSRSFDRHIKKRHEDIDRSRATTSDAK